MAVRVLHTFGAAGTIMPQARFPRVVADCDLDDAHLSSVRVRPARRATLGSDAIPDRMAQTHGSGRASAAATGH